MQTYAQLMPNAAAVKVVPDAALANWIIGTWISEVHVSKLGPIRLRIRFEADGHFFVTGFADDSKAREVYHRNGKFELRGNTFTSPAINEGRPVRLRREGDDLWFIIDQTLELRLSRLSPFAPKAK